MSEKRVKRPVKRVKTRPSLKGAGELMRERHTAGLAARKELEVEDPFETGEIEAPTPKKEHHPKTPLSVGPLPLKDKYSHDAGVLKSEWSLFGGELMPEEWLMTSKGYSEKQAKLFVGFEGISAWLEERTKVQNAILEKMAKRNIDQIVEGNEYFVKLGKLGLMKVMESLSKNSTKLLDPVTGKWNPGLSPKDMNELGNAADKFQTIWLKAMGIHPKDNVGIQAVINQLKVVNMSAPSVGPSGHTGGTTTEITTPDGTKVLTDGKAPDPRLETMEYDEMFKVIELIREAGFVKDEEGDDL